MQKHPLLISVDGLSWPQFSGLLELMPRAKNVFARRCHSETDGAPFTSAHAIWAEILTGKPWYANGCVGYARPDRSLNRLKVFTEQDLLQPINLLADKPTVLVANFPIVAPKKRGWLSDGSLPILTISHPPALDSFFPGGYKPRLYPSLTQGLTSRHRNVTELLIFETERLKGLAEITRQQQWEQVAVRLSVFDQLQHLCGSGCFEDERLFFRAELLQLLSKLDEFVEAACERYEPCIVSTFSHMRCKSRFNPNALLEKSGYLYIEESTITSARQQSRRVEAVGAMSGIGVSSRALRSTEGRYDVNLTRAAAPISGCIYLNRASAFEDGILSDSAAAQSGDELVSLFEETVLKHFGGLGKLVTNPAIDRNRAKSHVADYVLHLPSVEYFDIPGHVLDWSNVPRSCHSPMGFVAACDGWLQEQSLSPCELNPKLLEMGFGLN